MYAELHCKTNFSFLEGAAHADELVPRAKELGYRALAVTDRNSLSGIVRAHSAAKEHDLHLIIGAELHIQDALPLVVWAPDRAAYSNLSQLITDGRLRAPKGECELLLEDVAKYADGLLAAAIPKRSPAGNEYGNFHRYHDIFGDRLSILAEFHRGPEDDRHLAALQQLTHETNIPLLAAGDVHYHEAPRMLMYDVLTAIRLGTTVDAIGAERFANAERHLRTLEDLRELFRAIPGAMQRTLEIAARCTFSLDELRYDYPIELAPDGMAPIEFLKQLSWEGANCRYPDGIPNKVQNLLKHELALIAELRYEAYFLTVWDLVKFARSRGILCQGRGSAANSSVCYCIGVTAVDPDRTDLLFERFVSRERNEAPDIDVDFEHERREEVLQYIYDKYGRDRAGMTAVVTTYRMRSAVRDAGKALGLSLDRVDALAKQVDGYAHDDQFELRCQQVGIDTNSKKGKQLLDVVDTLVGFPRHLSQHVGGMVITQHRLSALVPIENAAMEDRTVICWDKNDLEELGILKVDCLGLGMLSAIRRCFEMIRLHTGRPLTLANVPPEDPAVYDMICRADTIGVFQIESRAQMSMLPRLQPRCYYDLVIEVAIVRPGPIQGQMVHPYLRRRGGQEAVEYANDEIRQVLEKTLGVPIFQEQAMKLAVVAAGFTPGEADQLRRAMGKWRKTGVMEQFRHKLVEGMRARQLPEEFAQQVFQQIRGFGEYGFPESHAASFALLVYVSAWLKHYYPAAFAAAIINSQPMGFYAPAQLIRDAKEHGVEVLPIDVNHSDWDLTLERADGRDKLDGRDKSVGKARLRPSRDAASDVPTENPTARSATVDSVRELGTGYENPCPSLSLRLGLRLIVGFSDRHAQQIVAEREAGPFESIEDFTRRTKLSRAEVKRLADADALASLGRNRRQSLWEALAQEKHAADLPLFETLHAEDDAPVTLPELVPMENVFADYETTGLTLRQHPIGFYRDALRDKHVRTAAELAEIPNNRLVRVAGIVLLRQRPATAKGITFVTLEDETGTSNLVLHQKMWERYYQIAKRSPAWVAFGKLESKYSVIHVVVSRLVDFSEFVETDQKIRHRSRDFR